MGGNVLDLFPIRLAVAVAARSVETIIDMRADELLREQSDVYVRARRSISQRARRIHESLQRERGQ